MKTTRIPLICSLACMLMSGPALAEEALVDLKVMTPEAALKVAKASMAACREQGFQVAVAVKVTAERRFGKGINAYQAHGYGAKFLDQDIPFHNRRSGSVPQFPPQLQVDGIL